MFGNTNHPKSGRDGFLDAAPAKGGMGSLGRDLLMRYQQFKSS